MSIQSQISTFSFHSLPVRIQSLGSEPFFCLLDVTAILGLGGRSVSKFKFDPKGVEKLSTPTTMGNQELTFINEPNLYRIIFRSNKAEAVDFQNWVFDEVLPQIRKTGKYSQTPPQTLPLTAPPQPTLYTVKHTEDDLQSLAWNWFALVRCIEFTQDIVAGLEGMQSPFTAKAHSIIAEYGSMARRHQLLIQRLTDEFEVDPFGDINWNRVLPTIRDMDILEPRTPTPNRSKSHAKRHLLNSPF